MPRFRKKPVEVEAWQFTAESGGTLAEWCGGTFHKRKTPGASILYIKTLEGTMTADEGDWIVKGIQGEFYPVKPDIFEATYERTET